MFIVSRASQDIEYVLWGETTNGTRRVIKTLRIKGGANVMDKTTMTTPKGVMNEISDEDWAWLEKDPAFARHMERGFMEVEKSESSARSSSKKKGKKKDGGAQLTPEDFEEKNQTPPKLNIN